ncbi:MAG: radical SAM protein [Candidatus Fermentibacteraceae bacterium]
MKVGLIYPRYNWVEYNGLYEPLGVLYLASALRESGHEPDFLDYTFCHELGDLDHRLSDKGLLGIAVSSAALLDKAAEVCAHIRSVVPDAPVVMGGAFPSIEPEVVLRRTGSDYVLVGEAEDSISELADVLDAGGDPRGVANLGWIDDDGGMRLNPRREIREDLDSIPHPARDLIDYDRYEASGFFEYSMVTTRGCPFKCIYCKPCTDRVFGGDIRYRSAADVRAEIRELAELRDNGSPRIFFQDDTITMHPTSWFEELRDGLREHGLSPVWHCNSRVDTVTEDKIRVMAESGCHCISFGVESGSQRILDFYRKGTTTRQAEQAFDWCHSLGVEATANLMIGFPLETNDDLQATYDHLKRIRPDDIIVYFSTAIPGQYMYDWARENGYLKEDQTGELMDPTNNRAREVTNMRLPYMTEGDVADWKHRIERYRSFRKMTDFHNIHEWALELVRHPGRAARKAGKVLKGLSGRPD